MAEVTYPCYWMRKDVRGEWRWTYYARNAEPIAVSSESYKRREDCSHSISLLKASSTHAVFVSE
ncbi:DUF1508 domain-containing protein [Variovorax paradoxus]|uniref:DUF1508 domain-containing protein n=1 Tax=Variovorax paradoxus TaxID=34073 RepID=UPI0035C8BCBF